MRLDVYKKGALLKEIKSGYSINSISRSLNLSKSTIYYYYKKLKGKKYKEPKYKIRFSETEGEIVGIFTGDGSQYYYRPNGQYQTSIHFGDNMPYVMYVKSLYDKYFDRNWPIYKEHGKKENVKYRIRTINKKIFHNFSNYLDYKREIKHSTVKLKQMEFPKRFKIGFLRGLVDTDGTVCVGKDKRIRIAYYTTSKNLAKQTKILLKNININSYLYTVNRDKSNWKNLFIIQIAQGDIDKFLNVIKPYKIRNLGA